MGFQSASRATVSQPVRVESSPSLLAPEAGAARVQPPAVGQEVVWDGRVWRVERLEQHGRALYAVVVPSAEYLQPAARCFFVPCVQLASGPR